MAALFVMSKSEKASVVISKSERLDTGCGVQNMTTGCEV